MKNSYILGAALASMLVLGLPALVGAQGPIGAGVTTTNNAVIPIPPPDLSPGSVLPVPPTSIKDRLESGYDARMQNLRNNEDYRNAVMGTTSGPWASTTAKLRNEIYKVPSLPGETTGPGAAMRLASTSPWRGYAEETTTEPRPYLMPPLMRRFASSTPFASTTITEQVDAKRGRVEKMRADLFAWAQDHLIGELTQALDNLKQIESRIASRIQTETQNGRDMSSSTRLFSVADGKINEADSAIKALAVYMPSASSTEDISASTTIDLGQPRTLGTAAIKAVNDAKQALNDVVAAIIGAPGPRPGENNRRNASTTIQ
ncbi:MAG: hypothetical protein ABSF56_01055 [Minisyncoccia bacterium]|jgi:hypothetical protein